MSNFALIDFGLIGPSVVQELEHRGHNCSLIISESQFKSEHNSLNARFVSVEEIFEQGSFDDFDNKSLEYFRANLDLLRRNAQRWIVSDHNHDDFFYTSFHAFCNCITILKKATVETVFSGIGSPHHYYNLIFYCATQYLGIKHFFFTPSFITNRVYIREGLSSEIWRVSNKYQDSSAVMQYVRDAAEPRPTTSSLEMHTNLFANPMGNIFALGLIYRAAFVIRSAAAYILKGKRFTGVVMLPPKRSYGIFYSLKNLRSVLQTYKLKKFYKSLISTDLPDKNYVLVLGPYQPEATTLPNAQGMADTRLMIAHLRSKLPNSVAIIYKEHPAAFLYSNVTYPATIDDHRSKSFYLQIAELGVFIADYRTNVGELCKKSLFVAGINGTFGIEMALKKKPVFMYSEAWYGKLPGVEVIDYDFDFQNIHQINTKHSTEDVVKHLIFLNENSLPNLTGTGSAQIQEGNIAVWCDEFDRILKTYASRTQEKVS